MPSDDDLASLQSEYTRSLLENAHWGVDQSAGSTGGGTASAPPSQPPSCSDEVVQQRWEAKYGVPPHSASDPAIRRAIDRVRIERRHQVLRSRLG